VPAISLCSMQDQNRQNKASQQSLQDCPLLLSVPPPT
jgi:hypothetical protein